MRHNAITLAKSVDTKILVIRGYKVIFDADLAALYGVSVKRLNQQVTRNKQRFPRDFVFRLTRSELAELRLQNATSSSGHGGNRYLPHVFTEHGAIMAATVLKSQRAIQMSVFVVRAFVRMREALGHNQQIMTKLAEIERRLESHDSDIQQLIQAIRSLMAAPRRNHRRIGFELPAHATGQRTSIAV